MKAHRISLASLILAAGGCGVFFSFDLGGRRETGSSKLVPFESQQELTEYLQAQVQQRNSQVPSFDRVFAGADGSLDGAPADSGSEAPPTPGTDLSGGTGGEDADGAGGNFSGTTIQEVGVDESDVVKTDGTYLYMITTGSSGSMLRIVKVFPAGDMSVVSDTALEGYGQEIYLHDDKIVALTSMGGYFGYPTVIGIEPIAVSGGGATDVIVAEDGVVEGEAGDDDRLSDPGVPPEILYQRPQTVVTVIDVSSRESPQILSTTRFDGSNGATRMVDGVLHLVLANYQDYYIDVMPLLGTSQLDVGAVDTGQLMPRFARAAGDGSDASGDVVTWRELYHPEDPDGFGMVYLVSLDVDNHAAFTAVGVVAEPGMIYSSRQALYLTDTKYDFTGATRGTTDIYKFAYQGRGAQPVATGSVPGRLLNQYSMGENEGYLRVATTLDRTFGVLGVVAESSNNVYVLEAAADGLDVIGSVENIAPGETIRACRFVGERGFVVTFREIDPLFTLDLSDPSNPRVIGELEVPGFSTYIVPIDDNHLLTVGQYIPPPPTFGPWGVQLSIYDITDFASPKVLDNVIIGADTGASSEAIWNPKAFTHFARAGLVAIPVNIYGGPFFFEDPVLDVDFDDSGTSSGGGSTGASPPSDIAAPAPDGGMDGVDVAEVEPYVPPGFDGVYVYSATVDGGLEELGRISTRFESLGLYGGAFNRGLFIEDASGEETTVYAVTNFGIRAVPLSALDAQPIELILEP
jgi:uncharacterized secreted protein with C-terminal beta-propeller domain